MREASTGDEARELEACLYRRQARWLTCAMAAAVVTPLQAQSTGQRELAIRPMLSIEETFSNNAEVSQFNPRSDAITELSAGINFQSNSGRLRGNLDYVLSGFLYARNPELNTYQNDLNANLGAELVENRVRADLRAGVTQSAISAFGVQPGLSGLPSTNVTEYRTLSIAPSFYGPLGPKVKYDAGLVYSISNARGTGEGDSVNANAFVRLGPSSPGVVGWSVDLTSVQSDYDAGRTTMDNRVNGTLLRKIDALDLLVSATAGTELTDLATFDSTRYLNWGIGATWQPSPRTKLVAQLDERFFGKGHTLLFEHRAALTTWTISDTRSLNSSGNGVNSSVQSSTGTGLNNNTGSNNVDAGYLRSGETVVRTQLVSVAYQGRRGSATLAVNRSVTVPIEGAPLPSDDFLNTSNIVTDSVSANLSHRLTPLSSLSLTASYQQSRGDRPEQFSSQRQVNLQYVDRLTQQSDLTVGVRRSLYKNDRTPYNEGALFATYGHRF